MNRLLRKRQLAENVIEYTFDAPDVVRNAKAGQFIILRVDEKSERVPFTICDYDKEKGTLTLLVQTVGASTKKLSDLKEGEYVNDLVGPLGMPTDLSFAKKALLVGGGIGAAVFLERKHSFGNAPAQNVLVGKPGNSRPCNFALFFFGLKPYLHTVRPLFYFILALNRRQGNIKYF